MYKLYWIHQHKWNTTHEECLLRFNYVLLAVYAFHATNKSCTKKQAHSPDLAIWYLTQQLISLQKYVSEHHSLYSVNTIIFSTTHYFVMFLFIHQNCSPNNTRKIHLKVQYCQQRKKGWKYEREKTIKKKPQKFHDKSWLLQACTVSV